MRMIKNNKINSTNQNLLKILKNKVNYLDNVMENDKFWDPLQVIIKIFFL